MNDTMPYFNEVIEAHIAIRQWFADAPVSGDNALKALMGRFDPDFSMITPTGQALDFQSLYTLFERSGGLRPGLEIEISDMVPIHVDAAGATITYRERQTTASASSVRYSTAVFKADSQGRVRWRHLHETLCAE